MEYFAFQWHITDSCDQRCEHCYIFSEGHPKLVEMPARSGAAGGGRLRGDVPSYGTPALFLHHGRRSDPA